MSATVENPSPPSVGKTREEEPVTQGATPFRTDGHTQWERERHGFSLLYHPVPTDLRTWEPQGAAIHPSPQGRAGTGQD